MRASIIHDSAQKVNIFLYRDARGALVRTDAAARDGRAQPANAGAHSHGTRDRDTNPVETPTLALGGTLRTCPTKQGGGVSAPPHAHAAHDQAVHSTPHSLEHRLHGGVVLGDVALDRLVGRRDLHIISRAGEQARVRPTAEVSWAGHVACRCAPGKRTKASLL